MKKIDYTLHIINRYFPLIVVNATARNFGKFSVGV